MIARTKTAHWNEIRNGKRPTYQYKKINDKMIQRVEGTIKAFLHASRDCLRNQGVDTSVVRYSVNDAYYGEAFGIMCGLEMMGYGHLSSCNLNGFEDSSTNHSAKQPEHNLRWWFEQLLEEVLEEENYNGDGHCDYCIERHYSDTKTAKEKGRR